MSLSDEIGKFFLVPGNVAGGISEGAMLLGALLSVLTATLAEK